MASVRLEIARWRAQMTAESEDGGLALPQHYELQHYEARVAGSAAHLPLTQHEQSLAVQYLELLDKQNSEILPLYQTHMNEIARVHSATEGQPELRERLLQVLQRRQENARLQLQQAQLEQQMLLLAQPPSSSNKGSLIRAPSTGDVDPIDHMIDMLQQEEVPIDPISTSVSVSPLGLEPSSDKALHHVPLNPTVSFAVDSSSSEPLPWPHPSGLAQSIPPEEISPAIVVGGPSLSVTSADPLSKLQVIGVDETEAVLSAVFQPTVIDLTEPESAPGINDAAQWAMVEDALRLAYQSRVSELKLEYQSDLVALFKELRPMEKSCASPVEAQKIAALMVDIKKILAVLTRKFDPNEAVTDDRVEALDRVERYIHQRLAPMCQRLKVKQAIFENQRGRAGVRNAAADAARTAQRQWQRFLRRMRDQQQTSLPVNLSPPRKCEEQVASG